MSARELVEWRAYFELEPRGEERADIQAAVVASTIANVNRGKSRRPFKLQDFMPLRKKRPEQTDHVGLSRRIRAAFVAFGKGKTDGDDR